MATQLFAKTEKELSSYFAVYRELLTATGWNGLELVMAKDEKGKLVPTGEVVEVFYPLSCEDKVVWCWMLDRFQFFKEQNGVWFDNQDEIATYCGVGLSTVKRFIKKLVISGVLHVEKKPMGGARFSNSYVITRDLVLVQKDKAKAPVPTKEQPQQPIQAPQELAAPQMDDFVPAGAEWASEAVPMDVYEDFLPELEDDGSCDDAFSYSEQSETQAPVTVQETKATSVARSGIESIDLTTLPEICYERNGSINDAMWNWLEDRDFYIEDPKDCIVHLNGARYTFKGRKFEVCNSEAVEEGAFSPF
ncbi:hypothetical protein A3710_17840 [Stutzerimonas frequens]|uniref:hypothetical protein n=1 Tax=Stutzerimonas frequens TaxID=2968969 RepID=UPI0007BA256F|nr:hypothetical protein [Stutzerimonas frequens]KZX62394.1 hypothetical protein A3710_17840 [Stutzerimonas frequens]